MVMLCSDRGVCALLGFPVNAVTLGQALLAGALLFLGLLLLLSSGTNRSKPAIVLALVGCLGGWALWPRGPPGGFSKSSGFAEGQGYSSSAFEQAWTQDRYRRADIAFAVDVHKRVAPSEAIGQWLRADPPQDWLTTGHTSEHLACLNRELQGNCHANGGKGAGSRRSFIDRRGSNLKNSPGILEGREDYAWRVNTSSAATVRLYEGWSGPRADLINWLELILGSDGRVVVLGDSLSRQFSQTLTCTFQYKLQMMGRVLYVPWNHGGKIPYVPKPSDVLVLNFGHWLDHGGDKLHVIQKKQWAIAFKDLANKQVAPNRVFVRTTQVRFMREDSPGEWNTTQGIWCGGTAPNASAAWTDFTTPLPEQNLVLLELIDASPYVVFDVSPITLARADQTFDCSHNCLPGVQDTWASLLFQQMIRFF